MSVYLYMKMYLSQVNKQDPLQLASGLKKKKNQMAAAILISILFKKLNQMSKMRRYSNKCFKVR